MLLTIIVPTKNEEATIDGCVQSVAWAVADGQAELIVIDNFSTDETAAVAERAGARVVCHGPERSAQRNRGALQEAAGEYLLFLDADMRMPKATLMEILAAIGRPDGPDAMYVREAIKAPGVWGCVRNFERSFYDGTCIDGLRVIRRSVFAQVGGFDERMFAGEDWDLDRRILAATSKTSITSGALIHDEQRLTLRMYLEKKKYYASNFDTYREKWHNDETVRKQFGVGYRFWTVFMEAGKWRHSLSRPHLLIAVWWFKARIGLMYFAGRKRQNG